MQRPQREYDEFNFDGHEVMGRYWAEGWVQMEIIPVDIDTDRGTKWETDVRCSDLRIDKVYDAELDIDIDPTPEIDEAIRQYFADNYTPNP